MKTGSQLKRGETVRLSDIWTERVLYAYCEDGAGFTVLTAAGWTSYGLDEGVLA